MEYLKFILYGLIQGLTEFLPVSSTAHLKIVSILFGVEDPGPSLSSIIQLGSVFAIFWYFRSDLFCFNSKKSINADTSLLLKKIIISICVGSIPFVFFGGIVKIFFYNFFSTNIRSNFLIAIVSIVMAFFMYFADTRKRNSINLSNHNYFNSLLIGLAQSFAIIPGVSRSGITISTALVFGWDRKEAAKYSFLLGIPAITIAAIVEFISFFNTFSFTNFFPLIVGLLSTFLSSLMAIDFLLKYFSKRGMKVFIYYRFMFGIFILLNM